MCSKDVDCGFVGDPAEDLGSYLSIGRVVADRRAGIGYDVVAAVGTGEVVRDGVLCVVAVAVADAEARAVERVEELDSAACRVSSGTSSDTTVSTSVPSWEWRSVIVSSDSSGRVGREKDGFVNGEGHRSKGRLAAVVNRVEAEHRVGVADSRERLRDELERLYLGLEAGDFFLAVLDGVDDGGLCLLVVGVV